MYTTHVYDSLKYMLVHCGQGRGKWSVRCSTELITQLFSVLGCSALDVVGSHQHKHTERERESRGGEVASINCCCPIEALCRYAGSSSLYVMLCRAADVVRQWAHISNSPEREREREECHPFGHQSPLHTSLYDLVVWPSLHTRRQTHWLQVIYKSLLGKSPRYLS